MNFHSCSTFRKLFKFQKKIQNTERKNPRLCRNFQRRLYRSSSMQFILINEILQLQFKIPRTSNSNTPGPMFLLTQRSDNFQKLNDIYQSGFLNQYPIIFSKLISKEYRYFLIQQIFNILWVFALSPILDNKKKDQIILTDLKDSQIYPTIYTFLKKPFIQYITLSQFGNFFNRKNKYWILSNLLIEKKFFLSWLKFDQKSTDNNSFLFSLGLKDKTIREELILQSENEPWQLQILAAKRKMDPLSLKTIFENFVNLSFSDFLHMLEFRNPNILPLSTKSPQSLFLLRPWIWVPTGSGAPNLLSCCAHGRYNSFVRSNKVNTKLTGSSKCTSQNPSYIAQFGLKHALYDFSLRQTHWNKKIDKERHIRLQIVRQKFANFKTGLQIKPAIPTCQSLAKFRRTQAHQNKGCPPSQLNLEDFVLKDPKRMGVAEQWVALVSKHPLSSVYLFSHQRLGMFHKLNNIDLKKGTVVNAITSISYKLSVPKDILSSLYPTSKFLYFDLVKQIATGWQFDGKIQLHKQHSSHLFFKHLMEYNGLILLALKKKRARRIIYNSLNDYAQIHGLKIKFIKFYSLDQGLHFLGWFFQKKNHSFEGFISHKNISNHQKELKHCLKTSKNKPMDKIIYELNQKILRWQKCYNCSIQFSKTCSQQDRKSKLNDDLFWFIWRWIKKRHRNRGSRWLYTRYWKKSTSRRWIFSAHQHTLIFYIR